MKAERFPVLKQRTKAEMPRSVPWAFAETFRAQARSNHGQSLETLAARGGLAPEEMWQAAHGRGLFAPGCPPEAECIAWLVATSAAYEAA